MISYVPVLQKTLVLNDASEAGTNEIPFKPMEEHNERLTSALSAGRRPLFVHGSLLSQLRPTNYFELLAA